MIWLDFDVLVIRFLLFKGDPGPLYLPLEDIKKRHIHMDRTRRRSTSIHVALNELSRSLMPCQKLDRILTCRDRPWQEFGTRDTGAFYLHPIYKNYLLLRKYSFTSQEEVERQCSSICQYCGNSIYTIKYEAEIRIIHHHSP